jgi:hypothetical protein
MGLILAKHSRHVVSQFPDMMMTKPKMTTAKEFNLIGDRPMT